VSPKEGEDGFAIYNTGLFDYRTTIGSIYTGEQWAVSFSVKGSNGKNPSLGTDLATVGFGAEIKEMVYNSETDEYEDKPGASYEFKPKEVKLINDQTYFIFDVTNGASKEYFTK
jgi:hypothetical protein